MMSYARSLSLQEAVSEPWVRRCADLAPVSLFSLQSLCAALMWTCEKTC